jgi:hypothetical protein
MNPWPTDVLARDRIDRFRREAARYRLAVSTNGRVSQERSDPRVVRAEPSSRPAERVCVEC